jgi:hypothetical protein
MKMSYKWEKIRRILRIDPWEESKNPFAHLQLVEVLLNGSMDATEESRIDIRRSPRRKVAGGKS